LAENALIKKLKTLIAFRVFFVTVILGSFFIFQIGYKVFPYPSAVLYLIVLLYSLTFMYAFLLKRMKSQPFAYVQLYIDVLATVALILLTGGIGSWFTSLLLLIVIAAAIVLNKRAGYATAIFGSLLYALVIGLQYYGILAVPYDPLLVEKDFLYKIFSIISALLLTAYLTGQLSARLERRTIDFEDLSLFNEEVIENTPSGLFTTDLDGSVQLFNRSAEDITGMDRAATVGRDIIELFPFIGRLENRRRMEDTVEFNGKGKIIGLSISSMKDAKGEKTGYIGIFQDLTELKKMAEIVKQKEKLAAIGEMSANMAHEIRNPLASLKSSVEMIRENAITKEKKSRLMDIALNEMDRLNGIITEFLHYSRPAALQVQDFDLHSALSETVELLKRRDSLTESVIFKINFKDPLVIKGDQQKFQQVFWNLGINALDAMPEGGELSISTFENESLVRITFADTGLGINKDNIEKVFYPFFTMKEEGTGLGLSIAYRIVEDHGGTLTIKSDVGEGTKVHILLPKSSIEPSLSDSMADSINGKEENYSEKLKA
jgi:two-component system sensor histidine kinase PilS (NtrC family)